MERSAGSCESWVHSWREDEAGGSCGLEGQLLGNLDKGFRRKERKGENRKRRKGKPFLRAVGEKEPEEEAAMEEDSQESCLSFFHSFSNTYQHSSTRPFLGLW